jgi:hypothetical protein
MNAARLLLLTASLLLVGCGTRDPAPLSPVKGRVWYQGQPLTGGMVVFTPDIQRGGSGPQAWAKIGADARHGATPGWHRITIATESSASLPTHFHDPEHSGQLFEVKADRPNVCELRLD